MTLTASPLYKCAPEPIPSPARPPFEVGLRDVVDFAASVSLIEILPGNPVLGSPLCA